ncbi:Bacteriophytochrome [compost metagenome]
MERLFQPFSRGEVEPNQKGLGLGLYIASEIAHAHNGTLKVSSNADKTCFTLNFANNNNDHR